MITIGIKLRIVTILLNNVFYVPYLQLMVGQNRQPVTAADKRQCLNAAARGTVHPP